MRGIVLYIYEDICKEMMLLVIKAVLNNDIVRMITNIEQNKFTLNRSYYGLYIPKGLWRRIDNFSTNSLALEFASTSYIPDDYIRNYDDYLQLRGNGEI